TLVLTADELNTLIQQSPEVKGKFHVSMVGDKFKAEMSLPLGELPGFKGRYLNGEADVVATAVDGRPAVHLRNVRVKGLPLPDSSRQVIKQNNLLGEEPPEKADAAPQSPIVYPLEAISIKDGKLTILVEKDPVKPKPASSEEDEPAKDDTAPPADAEKTSPRE